MSFFGFDPSQGPRQRGHPLEAPGFGETPDYFAGLQAKNLDDGDDDGIDFEDTYDGLGDALDETDDAFNDDTFGGTNIDRDFDFAGATAKIADVIQEEHAVYTRSNTKKQPIKPAAAPQAALADTSRLPALVPDMSLWGTSPAPALEHHQPQEHVLQPAAPPAPAGKRFMSLEEVEAQILAMNQKPPVPPQPSQQQQQQQQQHHHHYQPQIPTSQPIAHQFQHQLPQHTSAPGILPQFASPVIDLRFSHQLPPHLQQMIQQNQIPQHPQQLHQERGIPQPPPAQQQRVLSREPEPVIPPQGRNQYGMVAHMPAQQLQSMSEAERLRYLEEETKRLKRNHKIAQLARYNGLMTPQDKNFIQRIQLQQLVSINNAEDNINEDFYYIVHSAIRARSNPQQPLSQLAQTYLFRHGGRGNRRQDNHLQRMEQQVVRAVAAAKARPKASQLVLEGSLGKISFSNVKTPRPMLNIKKSETGTDHQGRKAHPKPLLADRKALLRAIENVYDALLELEIHERDRSKLPILQPGNPSHEAHTEWTLKRDQLAYKLYSEMKTQAPLDSSSHYTHPFIAILSFSKMKRAMPRIFRHLDQDQRLTVLSLIMVQLDLLDVVRHGIYRPDETQLPSAHREEIDIFANQVLPPLLNCVYESPFPIVCGLLKIMLDRFDIQPISTTKIGLQLLTMFLSRAEILKQSGLLGDLELHEWQMVYDRLFASLNGYWNDCFPPNGNFVDDQYVWQFLASMAVGANMQQQQTLVAAVKDRVLENVQASKILPPEIGMQKRENVNLFMRAMGLDVELLG